MTTTVLDFDGLPAGTVVDDDFATLGVTISAVANEPTGAANDALIFDTANPTGGDLDLAFADQGGALIISEDGDTSDPDDAAAGGVATFVFAMPATVEAVTILDNDEGGAIRALDDTGALLGTVDIPVGEDNGLVTLELPFTGVTTLEIEQVASGAIDDLVFELADEEPDEPPPADDAPISVSETFETADGTDVTFEIEVPAALTETTSTIAASLTLGAGGADNNVAFVIDMSGSTGGFFDGTPVGDVNGDGTADAILDAEIASLLNLSDEITALGLAPDEVEIGLIPFAGAAVLDGTFEPGSSELESALVSLFPIGATNFEAALGETLAFLSAEATADETNIVFFLSDGFPTAGGDFTDEAAALEDLFGAEIVAVGVGEGSDIATLDLIDNTGGAELVTTTDALDASLLDDAVGVGIEDLVVTVNGVVQAGIDEDDRVPTVFGFELPEQVIGDLDPTLGAENEVLVDLTLTDGTSVSLEATLTGDGFVVEDPVAEDPVVEEPVVEEPVVEEPVAEDPVAEDPVAEDPVAEDPVVEEPDDGFIGSELIAFTVFQESDGSPIFLPGVSPLTVIEGEIESGPAGGETFDDIPGVSIGNTVDFEASTFSLTVAPMALDFFIPGEFNGPVFFDPADEVPPIVDVTVVEPETTFPLGDGDLIFGEDAFALNLEGEPAVPGQQVVLEFEFGDPADATGDPVVFPALGITSAEDLVIPDTGGVTLADVADDFVLV